MTRSADTAYDRPMLARLLAVALLAAAPLRAQVRVSAERENLRDAPAGDILGVVLRGTALGAGEARGGWRAVTLEGWIWTPSVAAVGAAGAEVAVAVPGGENLRSAPGGDVVATIAVGTRLTVLGRSERWIRVRRSGWMWRASLAAAGRPAGAASGEGARPASAPSGAAAGARADPAAGGGAASEQAAAARADSVATAMPAVSPGGVARVAAGLAGAAILAAPGADTIARLEPLGRVQVLEEREGWSRVRVEGWVPTARLAAAGDTSVVLGDEAAAILGRDPSALRGRRVEWHLRFLRLQRADSLRADFQPGQPFLLATGPGASNGLVYVGVPPRLLRRVRALRPLESFVALARVREPRSRQTGVPVLDLLDFR